MTEELGELSTGISGVYSDADRAYGERMRRRHVRCKVHHDHLVVVGWGRAFMRCRCPARRPLCLTTGCNRIAIPADGPFCWRHDWANFP